MSDSKSPGTRITFTVTLEFAAQLEVPDSTLLSQAELALRMATFGGNKTAANPTHVHIDHHTNDTGART